MIQLGAKVASTEHPKSVGTVVRVTEDGATIEFTTPRSERLPFGHIIAEFWPVADYSQLVVL